MKREILVFVMLILFSSFVFAEECILDIDCQSSGEEFASLMYCSNGVCELDTNIVASLGLCLDDDWCEEGFYCSANSVCILGEVLEPVEVGIVVDAECNVKRDCELLDPDQGFATSCINGECVIDESLLIALDLSCVLDVDCEEGDSCLEGYCFENECDLDEDCEEGYFCVDNYCQDLELELCSSAEPCVEGECIDGFCVTEVEIETYGVEVHCVGSWDCEYDDDVCYKGLCQQVFGFPPKIELNGVEVSLDLKICEVDSDCGLRKFCDIGMNIDDKHYCSKTPNAAETDVRVAAVFDPLADIVDVSRIAMTGDDVKKIELEIKRLERLQISARRWDAMAVGNDVNIKRVEKKFELVEERLQSVDVKINSMKTALESSAVSGEEKLIIEQNIQKLEQKKYEKKLDVENDLQTAVSQLNSNILGTQKKKWEVQDRLEETQLSVEEKETKSKVVKKRNEDYIKKLERRKQSTQRSSAVSSGTQQASSSTQTSADRPSGGLTPEQIKKIKEEERRRRAALAAAGSSSSDGS
jgi:hypothetical protein